MQRFEARAFLCLLLGVSLLFGWLLLPFFDVLFWAMVIGVLFTPINKILCHRLRLGPSPAALLTVLFCLVVIILPLLWLIYSCVEEATALYARLSQETSTVADMVDRLKEAFPSVQNWLAQYGYDAARIKKELSSLALSAGGILARNTVWLVKVGDMGMAVDETWHYPAACCIDDLCAFRHSNISTYCYDFSVLNKDTAFLVGFSGHGHNFTVNNSCHGTVSSFGTQFPCVRDFPFTQSYHSTWILENKGFRSILMKNSSSCMNFHDIF